MLPHDYMAQLQAALHSATWSAILGAFLGAAAGSFLNLCIDRLPRGESILHPSSHCDGCGAPLRWMQLVPIISFLAQRGRCPACRSPIPYRVLAVEALAAGAMAYVGYRFGVTWQALVLALYILAFLLVACTDLERGIVPNKVVYPAAVAALPLSLLVPDLGLSRALLGGAVGLTTMLALYIAARGGMGGGDVKLAALVGLTTGFPLVIPALTVAALTGGLAALLLLATRLKRRGDAVPFGPFLSFGAVVSILWGANLAAVLVIS